MGVVSGRNMCLLALCPPLESGMRQFDISRLGTHLLGQYFTEERASAIDGAI
jgi:hypothetical protein